MFDADINELKNSKFKKLEECEKMLDEIQSIGCK